MRTLTVGLLVALCLMVAAGPASADSAALIRGAALIPYFNASPSSLAFLLIASPVSDQAPVASDEHLFYYTAACVRQESSFIPQTQNKGSLFVVNGETSITEGLILLTGTTTGTDQVALVDPFWVRLLWYDGTVDHGRVIDPAKRVEASTFGGGNWEELDNGAGLLFMPPDDGAVFFDRVIFSCPLGTTTGTLAFDMTAVSIGGYSPLTSAVALFAVIYDTDETPINDWRADCQCVGIKPAGASAFSPVIRLANLNPKYVLGDTYTEIQSQGPGGEVGDQGLSPRFMLHWGIEVHVGAADVDWFGRGHYGNGGTGGAGIFAP